MSSVGEKVRAVLIADPGVSALVNARIFPSKLPQPVTYPAVRYFVPSDVPVNSLGGFTSGLRNARVQVDAYAKKYADAQALADAIVGALGSLTGASLSSLLMSRSDLYEDVNELQRVRLDFSMWTGD